MNYIKMLESESVAKRCQAAKALGEIGDAAAIPALVQALNDSHEVHSRAIEALKKIGVVQEPAVLQALQDNDVHVRCIAAHILGTLRNKVAVLALIQALHDSDSSIRSCAIIALERIGDVTAVPSMIQFLQDEKVEFRLLAIKTLGVIGDATALPALFQALQDGNYDVRNCSIQALGKIGDPTAIPALIHAIQDTVGNIPKNAVFCLVFGFCCFS